MAAAVPLVPVVQKLSGRDDAAPLPQKGDRPAAPTSHLLGFAILLLCWQTALLSALLCGFIASGPFVALHVTSCFALAIWVVWRAGDAPLKSPHAVAIQMIAWSAIGGPHGALVVAALSFRPSPKRTNAVRSDESGSTAVNLPSITGAGHLHLALRNRRIRIEGAHRTRSLIDVIAEGSRSEKLDALAVVYRLYEARLALVLKRALQDADASVRVLAATVTAKLNATFSRKIGDCQAAAAARPDVARNFRNIAEARLAHVESGLLEASQAHAEAAAAIRDLARAAEIDPVDPDTAACLDRACRQMASWQR